MFADVSLSGVLAGLSGISAVSVAVGVGLLFIVQSFLGGSKFDVSGKIKRFLGKNDPKLDFIKEKAARKYEDKVSKKKAAEEEAAWQEAIQ